MVNVKETSRHYFSLSFFCGYVKKDWKEMVFTIYDVMEAGMNKTMTTDVNKTKFWSIKQIFHIGQWYDQSNYN